MDRVLRDAVSGDKQFQNDSVANDETRQTKLVRTTSDTVSNGSISEHKSRAGFVLINSIFQCAGSIDFIRQQYKFIALGASVNKPVMVRLEHNGLPP
jgi:hypothetical protein